jgi:RNA polymerase sigma factor for flagellar operon FliA
MGYQDASSCESKIGGRERLILEHCGIAKAIALQIHKTLPVHVDLDDLTQVGLMGLLDAAKKYDPTKQVDFSCYAKHRIRGAILDSLRELDTASRDRRRWLKRIETARHELRATLQRDPTETEVAERLDTDVSHLRKIMREVHTARQISTSYSPPDETPMEHEYEGRPETRPDHVFSRAELRGALEKAMKHLRPRQRQVVRAYYSEQKTMKEIGYSLGINESRVSQLHKAALANMQTQLLANGIQSCGAF